MTVKRITVPPLIDVMNHWCIANIFLVEDAMYQHNRNNVFKEWTSYSESELCNIKRVDYVLKEWTEAAWLSFLVSLVEIELVRSRYLKCSVWIRTLSKLFRVNVNSSKMLQFVNVSFHQLHLFQQAMCWHVSLCVLIYVIQANKWKLLNGGPHDSWEGTLFLLSFIVGMLVQIPYL